MQHSRGCCAEAVSSSACEERVRVVQLPHASWHELIVGVLNMVDIVLTANLVLIIVFSGYENFLQKVDARDHADWPEGLTAIEGGLA